MWMTVLTIAALLVQTVSGPLPGPDPAQMEKAPDLGYKAVPHGLQLPAGVTMGAPSGVQFTRDGHLIVFNRGPNPLLEFDKDGAFVRSMGEGMYVRPHGFRLDPQGNLWTTDVNGHTVTKLSPRGEVLLTMGVKGQAGEWNEAANSRLLNEPTDLAFGSAGEIFILQGHGRGEPRVLKFDRNGKLTKSWGGQGTGPGQFDTSHSIVVDAKGLVYVADRQNRRVQIFDGNGKYVKEWKFAGLPCGLFFGPGEQLYLVTGFAGQILKLDSNGKAIAATGQPGKGLGEFGEAHYMTIGPRAEIYVADTVGSRLHKFVKK
jgi:DNA-binding beta-propeller fold protein YncE